MSDSFTKGFIKDFIKLCADLFPIIMVVILLIAYSNQDKKIEKLEQQVTTLTEHMEDKDGD